MHAGPVCFTLYMLLGSLAACGSGATVTPPARRAASTGAEQASMSNEPSASMPSRFCAMSDAAVAIVNAPDRTEADREIDFGRHPAETLTFFRVAPGQRIVDLAAAGGYTTELLARAVGPTGKVYGQNSKWLIENFAELPFSRRLARPVMQNVVRIDREFEDPFPADAENLDAVFFVMFYHDLFWMNVDRDKFNRAVFQALKSGGTYAIIDHSGRSGTGATEVKSLHRIEEKLVRAEIEKAGFRLRSEASFLRNGNDSRDWAPAPGPIPGRRGTTDRFVLAYEKP
ncbi:MAG TPA: SAM-dependent methyltransferase [Polyangiaceae bacterium]|nr:SAM-dependent methyltransferase [Polyangiaceae bacterium]